MHGQPAERDLVSRAFSPLLSRKRTPGVDCMSELDGPGPRYTHALRVGLKGSGEHCILPINRIRNSSRFPVWVFEAERIWEGQTMEHQVYTEWDEAQWTSVLPIFDEAFGQYGRKPDAVVQSMVKTGLGVIHTAHVGNRVVAMALTGRLPEIDALLIDYLAVDEHQRNNSIGSQFLSFILEWAKNTLDVSLAVVEVQANGDDAAAAVGFWRKNGFNVTPYVHQYVWVPEPYSAMYRTLTQPAYSPVDGRDLFTHISRFHGLSYRRG